MRHVHIFAPGETVETTTGDTVLTRLRNCGGWRGRVGSALGRLAWLSGRWWSRALLVLLVISGSFLNLFLVALPQAVPGVLESVAGRVIFVFLAITTIAYSQVFNTAAASNSIVAWRVLREFDFWFLCANSVLVVLSGAFLFPDLRIVSILMNLGGNIPFLLIDAMLVSVRGRRSPIRFTPAFCIVAQLVANLLPAITFTLQVTPETRDDATVPSFAASIFSLNARRFMVNRLWTVSFYCVKLSYMLWWSWNTLPARMVLLRQPVEIVDGPPPPPPTESDAAVEVVELPTATVGDGEVGAVALQKAIAREDDAKDGHERFSPMLVVDAVECEDVESARGGDEHVDDKGEHAAMNGNGHVPTAVLLVPQSEVEDVASALASELSWNVTTGLDRDKREGADDATKESHTDAPPADDAFKLDLHVTYKPRISRVWRGRPALIYTRPFSVDVCVDATLTSAALSCVRKRTRGRVAPTSSEAPVDSHAGGCCTCTDDGASSPPPPPVFNRSIACALFTVCAVAGALLSCILVALEAWSSSRPSAALDGSFRAVVSLAMLALGVEILRCNPKILRMVFRSFDFWFLQLQNATLSACLWRSLPERCAGVVGAFTFLFFLRVGLADSALLHRRASLTYALLSLAYIGGLFAALYGHYLHETVLRFAGMDLELRGFAGDRLSLLAILHARMLWTELRSGGRRLHFITRPVYSDRAPVEDDGAGASRTASTATVSTPASPTAKPVRSTAW